VNVSKAGIAITVQIANILEPGMLKDRIDMAWQSIKAGLVRGLSIGFQGIETEAIAGTWGVNFLKWAFLECSAVTIPANASGTIQSIKSFDRQHLAASGQLDAHPVVRLTLPGVSGRTKSLPKPGDTPMNIAEQIKAFNAERTTKATRMEAIMDEAGKAGSTLTAEQDEEFKTLDVEVKAIDEHLSRLGTMEALAKRAQPVDQTARTTAATETRQFATVKAVEKLAPGILFARHAMAVFAAKGNLYEAAQLARTHYGEDSPVTKSLQFGGGRSMETVLKAAVNAGTTIDATYAGPLVQYVNYAGDFVDFLRPRTIVGRFGLNGVPALRRIPFNVHIKGQTVGGTGYWVGEGKPKPVTAFGFNDTYHGWFKVAAIAVLTDDLIRFSDPSAENYVRDSLADVLSARMDLSFIDPAFAGAANVSPASITNGATSIASSGNTIAEIRADIRALWAAADTADNFMDSPVYITTPKILRGLADLQNPLGQPEFPGLTPQGGNIAGVPVIASNYVPGDTAGGLFVLVNASDIYMSDDGQATVDFSNQASIQMLDNPTNDATNGTATSVVSMFQTDSTALRAHRFANWSRRRNSAVSYLTGVNWGS
jgi:HK97 family phage major capsid protein